MGLNFPSLFTYGAVLFFLLFVLDELLQPIFLNLFFIFLSWAIILIFSNILTPSKPLHIVVT